MMAVLVEEDAYDAAAYEVVVDVVACRTVVETHQVHKTHVEVVEDGTPAAAAVAVALASRHYHYSQHWNYVTQFQVPSIDGLILISSYGSLPASVRS